MKIEKLRLQDLPLHRQPEPLPDLPEIDHTIISPKLWEEIWRVANAKGPLTPAQNIHYHRYYTDVTNDAFQPMFWMIQSLVAALAARKGVVDDNS